MSNVLSKWGTYIFVTQLILGGIAYLVAAYFGIGDTTPGRLSLFVAGATALIFVFAAIAMDKWLGATVAASSVMAVLAIRCFLNGSDIFAYIFGCFSVALAILPAVSVKMQNPNERLPYLVLSALPVVGAFMYLSSRLDEEREKMFRG